MPMILKRTRQFLSFVLALVISAGLISTDVQADTVNKVSEKTGKDGSIVVTIYDQDPGSAGTGDSIEGSRTGSPVGGVDIYALRVGSVVELTSTGTDGTVSTQVAFGIPDTYVSLLGLNTANAIASQTDGGSNTATYYFEPTEVQTSLSKNNSESGGQSKIEEELAKSSLKATTTSTGSATFRDLQYGLYLLGKSELPSDATTDLVPFLVSVPMYVKSESAGRWENTVYAYPKVRTGDISIQKTVDDTDKNVNAGQTLKYTVTATIPASKSTTGTGSSNIFSSFEITDTNTGDTLDIDTENSLSVKIGDTGLKGINSVEYNNKNEEDKKEYEYTYTYTHTDGGQLILSLTSTGLGKLNDDLTKAQTITVTYNATIATDVTFSSVISNTAKATYKRSGMSEPAKVQSEAVNLYTYGIDLTKTLSDQNDKILGNKISFELYKTYDDQTETLSNKVSVKVVEGGYWVTATENVSSACMCVGTDGKLTLYGLEPGTYYMKETATMNGYTLLDEPITIVITASESSGNAPAISATVNNSQAVVKNGLVTLSVKNTKNEAGFTLPTTGGAGTLAATAVGLGLLCAAVILLVVYRRKNQEGA